MVLPTPPSLSCRPRDIDVGKNDRNTMMRVSSKNEDDEEDEEVRLRDVFDDSYGHEKSKMKDLKTLQIMSVTSMMTTQTLL